MNGEDLYLAQKKYMVRKLRFWLNVKIERHKEKKLIRKEKLIDIFNRRDALSVANFFSYLRIILAFFIILALENHNYILINLIFTLGLLTDWLDGIFAEVYDEITEIGKIIDPTADKFLIIGALWPYQELILWPFENLELKPIYILMGLETVLMISAFVKPWINKKYGYKFRTGANIWGKGKMLVESIMVYCILFFGFEKPTINTVIDLLLAISITLAVMSFLNHWRIKSPD